MLWLGYRSIFGLYRDSSPHRAWSMWSYRPLLLAAHKQYLHICFGQKILDDRLVNTMCRPFKFCVALLLFTHAFDTICVTSSGTSWGRNSWWSFWLADMVLFTASVCPVPAVWGASLTPGLPPTALLRKHCALSEERRRWPTGCGEQALDVHGQICSFTVPQLHSSP